ncbi:MAG TPA: hypothetical protein VFV75_16225 [Candidatus Polarisedimenticolaceae bacterium]|nr:hypothetical protein [Candidatus Polarisedimenticolaceae bacterium]
MALRKLSRREIGLLGAAAIALVVWAVRPGADASLPPLPGKAGDQKADAGSGEAPQVQLALLQADQVPYDPAGRDLFQYSQRPPSAAEIARMRAEAAEAERLRREAEERARLLAQQQAEEARLRADALAKNPPPPPRPRPPTLTAKYLGCMGPRGNRIAFFERDKELIMAKEGEPFLHDFKVVKINYETVTVGFTSPQFKDEVQEIPMSRTR